MLRPDQIAHAMFPLGGSVKDEVRAEAAARGLAVADKPDSHDICFIADGDTRAFLQKRLGSQPGPIVDAVSGEVVGGHDGAYAFTVGQRRGLRVGVPAADGKPRYVLDVSPVSNTVTIGPADLLDVTTVVAGGADVVWRGALAAVRGACAAAGARRAAAMHGRCRRRVARRTPARRGARDRTRTDRRGV